LIQIERKADGITMNGHADYAPHGQDVVCAGVSTLIQTLIQSIEELTNDTIEYSMSPGRVDIKHGNLSERAQALVDSFFIGIELIAGEFPDNVRASKH
jgi:uncharacterized protein YsxB (DUF464 family)